MAPVLNGFMDWCSVIHPLDWTAMALFGFVVIGYRSFLALMLSSKPDKLYLGKLQSYRIAWLTAHFGDPNGIVAVQTLRNSIMAASFLASTAVILIMGAINLLGNLNTLDTTIPGLQWFGPADPTVNLLKILLIIINLSYSFFNFTNFIREVNYMSFILNIPKDKLDEIEGGDSTHLLANIFLTSGIHFSMGMRGYYFLIPLFLWIFSPALMIAATLIIMLSLLRRDLRS